MSWIKKLKNHPCFLQWRAKDATFDYSMYHVSQKRGTYEPPDRIIYNTLFREMKNSNVDDGQVKSKKSIESFYRTLKKDRYRDQYLSKTQIFARWLAEQCSFREIVGVYESCDDAFEKFLINISDQTAELKGKEHTVRGFETAMKKCFKSVNLEVSSYSLDVIKNRRKEHKKKFPSVPRYKMPFNMLCELVVRQFEAFYTVIRGGVIHVDRKTQSGNTKTQLSKDEVIRDTLNIVLIVLAINRPSDNLVFVDAVERDEDKKCWVIRRGGAFVRVEDKEDETGESEEYQLGVRKGDGGKDNDEVRIYDAENCYINPGIVFKEWFKLIDGLDNVGKGKDKLLKQVSRSGKATAKNLGSRSVSTLISTRFKEIIDDQDFPKYLTEKLPPNFQPFAYLLRYATITAARKDVRDEKTGSTLISDVDVAHNADHKIQGTSASNVYTGVGGEDIGFSFGIHMLVGMNKYVEEMYRYENKGSLLSLKRARPRTRAPPNVRSMVDMQMNMRNRKQKKGELVDRKKGEKKRRRLEVIDDDNDDESPSPKKSKLHHFPAFSMIPFQQQMMYPQTMMYPPMVMPQQPMMMAPMMPRMMPQMMPPMMQPYRPPQIMNSRMKEELEKLERKRMEIMRGDFEE